MKKVITWTAAALVTAALTASALAADASHTVAAGDTMWKLASAYQVGTSEIIAANPQIPNPNLIYPGQVLRIPQVPEASTGSWPGWPGTSPRTWWPTATSPTPVPPTAPPSR